MLKNFCWKPNIGLPEGNGVENEVPERQLNGTRKFFPMSTIFRCVRMAELGRCNSATYLNFSEQSGIQMLKSEGLVFVDDNCPIHRAKIVKKWMQENGIEREHWPADSPDFNPMENMWAWMKQQMKSRFIEPEYLVKVLEDLFAKVTNSIIVGLYNSM